MTKEEIKSAIDNQKHLFFCEAKSGGFSMIECIPNGMVGGSGFLMVGVFIPAGLRAFVVEAALLGRDRQEAMAQTCQRNAMVSKLSSASWEYGADMIKAERQRLELALDEQIPNKDEMN